MQNFFVFDQATTAMTIQSNILLTDEEPGAIWNPNATVNWSVLFTPAFGAWLQMQNWISMGEPELAALSKKWFYGSLIVTLISTCFGIFGSQLSSDDLSGNYLMGGYLMIWYVVSARGQVKYVKDRFGEDYNRLPWKKPLLIAIGLAFFLIMLNVAAGVGFGIVGVSN